MTPNASGLFSTYLRGLLLALLVTLSIASALQGFATYRASSRTLNELHGTLSRLVGERIDEPFRDAELLMAGLPVQFKGTVLDALPQLEASLAQVPINVPSVQYVRVFDAQAAPLAFSTYSNSLVVASSRPSRAEAGAAREALTRGKFASPVYYDLTVPFMYTAIASRPPVEWAAVARLDLQGISEQLGKIVKDFEGQALVVDGEGNMLAHSDAFEITKGKESPLPPFIQAVLSSIGATEGGHKSGAHPTNTALSGAGLHALPTGEKVWASWHTLERNGWRVIFYQPWQTAFASLIRLGWITLGVLVLGALMALAAGYWLARRMAQPIAALAEGASHLAERNFEHRMPEQGPKEIAQLAQRFNSMAGELGSVYKNMESTITERTAQLGEQLKARAEQDQRIAILEERTRIMRDIHDGVGGHLVGLLAAAKNDRVDAKHVESVAQQALVDFRIAIDSLAPVEGDFQTVLGTLRYRLAKQLEAAGIQSEWTIGDLPQLSDQRRESVFNLQRVVSEALTNAIKHARATKVWVDAHWADETHTLTVSVADNGMGITPGLTAGVGLQSMTKRAKAMGAELLVEPNPVGKGTVVRLVLVDPKASAVLTV